MIAVIGCAAWAIVTVGGMVALGLWLERDYQRGAQLLADEALAAHLSYLYGEAEALTLCLRNYTDPAMLGRLQGEIDGIMVEIVNVTNSTNGGN